MDWNENRSIPYLLALLLWVPLEEYALFRNFRIYKNHDSHDHYHRLRDIMCIKVGIKYILYYDTYYQAHI